MKILIAALDNLGDVVMTTAVLRPIQKMIPGASIGLWVKDYAAGLFEDPSMVDRVHSCDPPWDSAPGRTKGEWMKLFETLRAIRAEKYDLAFIFNTEWRRALACRLAGIPVRVGFDRRKSRPFLTQAVPVSETPVARVAEHRALLEAYFNKSLPSDWFCPRVEIAAKEKEWSDQWTGRQGWNGSPLLVLHPFSGNPERNWPLSRWFELIRTLWKKNENLKFAFSCSPAERPLLQDEISMIDRTRCFVESTSLPEIKGILHQSALFIGGDSGPGHLAAAMGKPVLSLFGPSDPAVYAPRGRGRIEVIRRQPLSSLPVEEVARKAMEFL